MLISAYVLCSFVRPEEGRVCHVAIINRSQSTTGQRLQDFFAFVFQGLYKGHSEKYQLKYLQALDFAEQAF